MSWRSMWHMPALLVAEMIRADADAEVWHGGGAVERVTMASVAVAKGVAAAVAVVEDAMGAF